MTGITLQLRLETEQKLREKASRLGKPFESFVAEMIERVVAEGTGQGPDFQTAALTADQASTEQWVAELRAWAASHRNLPAQADDSRESNLQRPRGMSTLLDTNVLTRRAQPSHPEHRAALDALAVLRGEGDAANTPKASGREREAKAK